MINYRIIARVFSQVLILEGLFMMLAAAVSYLYKEDAASSFFWAALITIITGIFVFSPLKNENKAYGTREGFIIVTGIWFLLSVFSTLPFLFSRSAFSFTDAFFESMSGFTTTGSSIFTEIESLPRGILFWRCLTQWLGGISVIILALYSIPILKSLNIQLSTIEFSGQTTDKLHPKILDSVKVLVTVYSFLTLIEILLLIIGKMSLFDAICHSFTTMSTGGFSTRNEGIASFTSQYIRIILMVFMFLAGTNITIIYFGLKKNFKKIINNNEFICYTLIVFIFSIIVSLIILVNTGSSFGDSISDGFFHVISIITTTGFFSCDFNLWNNSLVVIIFMLMFIGGMAGSASGGIKVIRLFIIAKTNRKEIKKMLHPSAFLPVRVDYKIVPHYIILNLLLFVILYFLILCTGAFFISIMDHDLLESFTMSASMLGNIGPALDSFGAFPNYSEIPSQGKWFLCLLMIVGRLELMTVIIFFTQPFYKK